MEWQLFKYVNIDRKTKGSTSQVLLQLLEVCHDNVFKHLLKCQVMITIQQNLKLACLISKFHDRMHVLQSGYDVFE